MNENNQYIKFMSDIIDSGTWAEMSSCAKSLYLVLLKFSDQNFKHVWPSTDTLLKLTGFKTKRSLLIAKKDLINIGLIDTIPGKGHTNSKYYFSFNYKNSKISPQRYNSIPLKGIHTNPSEETILKTERGKNLPPNNINISINNTQSLDNYDKNNDNKNNMDKLNISHQSIIEDFGLEVFKEAYNEALDLGLSFDNGLIKKLCVKRLKSGNNLIKKNHKMIPDFVWVEFLEWAGKNLTVSSNEFLQTVLIEIKNNVLLIKTPISNFLKQVIVKYFNEEVKFQLYVLFSDSEKSEIVENRLESV